jgi:hypothetical protein
MSTTVLCGDMIRRSTVEDILIQRFNPESIEDFLKLVFYDDEQITFNEFSQNCFEYLFELSDISREELLFQIEEEK